VTIITLPSLNESSASASSVPLAGGEVGSSVTVDTWEVEDDEDDTEEFDEVEAWCDSEGGLM